MARATTKAELLRASALNFEKLNGFIASLTVEELRTPFDFSADEKKKEAHWQRDRNLRDILVHLYEWHQLLLRWVASNLNGVDAPFLPAPYNWKTYGDMNVGLWERHQGTSLEDADRLYKQSHAEVMALTEVFTDEQLFTKGAFAWVGGSTLGSYFVSATASHYDWAIKKLQAHRKCCRNN